MPLALRSRFLVGVYNPEIDDTWPYFHFDEGQYLSKAKRLCSFKSAIELDSPDQAREFYSSWKHAGRYRLSVREYKTHIAIPMPTFPEGHPRSILDRVHQNEIRSIYRTAFTWFTGDNNFYLSRATIAKHRKVLLSYGIDIYLKPDRLLEPLNLDDERWHLSTPALSIA